MALKRWRWSAVFGPELMLCLGDARVAGLPQRWWAVALPDGRLFERTSALPLRPPFEVEFDLEQARPVEVVSEHGGRRIWTRKRAGVPVRGHVRVGGRSWPIDGPVGFVDESRGRHARHTTWRWSAGIGVARGGQRVAWNLVEGLHDSPRGSERAVWVDGDPHEVPPQRFAPDLSSVGGLRFTEWCAREDHTNRLLIRSDYRQPFGSFSGTLPGGLELESGHGVMEWHEAWW